MYHHLDRKNQLFLMRYIPSLFHEILWSKLPSGGRFIIRPISYLHQSHIAWDKLSICSHIGLSLMKSLMLENPVAFPQHTRISDLMRWCILSFNIWYVGCSASFDESFVCKILNKSNIP